MCIRDRLYAVDGVALLQEKLGQVGPVLAGDAGYEGGLGHCPPSPSRYHWYVRRMPSSRETRGFQPNLLMRETSISFWGVPSGRDESHLISPSCPTILCTSRASSETVRSSPTPMFIIPSGRLAGRSSPPRSLSNCLLYTSPSPR